MALDDSENGGDDTNLNATTAFEDIKCHDSTQWNHVHCTTAKENFRAGESVEISPVLNLVTTLAFVEVPNCT